VKLENLFELFAQASELSGHREFVVIGSLSILALEDAFEVPSRMTMSNDVEAYTLTDPGRIFDLNDALGENSAWHVRSGYYLDPVSPNMPSFPEGWRDRLIPLERDRIKLWFVEANDAAISKYARGEERDRRWIQEGILAGAVSLPVVRSRFPTVRHDNSEEERNAKRLLAEDEIWFEAIKKVRRTVTAPRA
jgi:hypothetical protein